MSAAVFLVLSSLAALPAAQAAGGAGTPWSDSPATSNIPSGCSSAFNDGCYHMRGGLNALDSPKIDVLLVVPASPWAERDLRAMHQVVDMYDAGIDYIAEREGWSWLADGVEFHVTPMVCDFTTDGCGEFSTYPLFDPEIVIIRANPFFVPVGLGAIVGIGIDPFAEFPCYPGGVQNPFDIEEWNALPGFDSHHDGRSGTYSEDCAGSGGNTCYAINGGLEVAPDVDLFGINVYDLVAHEFGHCLRLGHVGDAGTEFSAATAPLDDIMSYVWDDTRKCVSSLDVETFAVAMSPYLDVNGDGSVTPADRFYYNDKNGNNGGDGDPFQVQHPDDHYYASSTGKAADCPQPDLGMEPLGEPVDFNPGGDVTPPGTAAVHIASPEDGATVEPAILTVSGTVDRSFTGAPTASLFASPSTGSAPLEVTFTMGATDDGSIASFSLDFDDGSLPLSGTGSPPTTATHTYTESGVFTATLTVTDDEGNTDSATATVTLAGAGRVLWLVGDGTVNVGIDSPNANTPADKAFEMSPDGNGPADTLYTTVGSWNMDSPDNPFVPTFVYDGPVTLSGETLHLLVDVDYAFPLNGQVLSCPLVAQILTKDGTTVLGPAGGADAVVETGLPGTTHEIDFAIDPLAGSYDGLMVQFGTTGVDCGSFPATWAWGGDNFDGRLVLGASDSGGGPGPTAGLATADPVVGPVAPVPPGLGQVPLLGDIPKLASEPTGDGPLLDVWGDIGDVTLSNDDDALTVRLDLVGLLDGNVPTVLGNPFTYQVSFTAGHNFAAGLEYRVTYSYDLVQTQDLVPTGALVADTFELLVATAPNAGGVSTLCRVATDLSGSFFDIENGDIVWVVPLTAFSQDNQPPQGDCAFTTGGRALQGGDVLTGVMGEAATKVATVTIGGLGDTTDPYDYTLSGSAVPLAAEAGGPYSGATGAAVAVSGSATGGAAPYSCAWSGSGASFADASACATTVTYASTGTHTVTLTVTDADSATATDTATVTVTDPERVVVTMAGVEASDTVTTSEASPTDSWSVNLDLSGVADGTYTLTATWIDADGTILDTDSIEVTVDAGNSAPVLVVPASASGSEGAGMGFTVSATDSDGDDVTLEAVSLPLGAAFDASTGTFTWTPSHEQAGSHAATFRATDSQGATGEGSVAIEVADVNRAPILDDLSDVTVSARNTVSFTVSAVDPDGDEVAFGSGALPEGASFDAGTGVFSWSPTKKQTGVYTLDFTASDGLLEDLDSMTITVIKK